MVKLNKHLSNPVIKTVNRAAFKKIGEQGASPSIFYNAKAQRNLESAERAAPAGQERCLKHFSDRKTMSKLKELRKREFAPDPSFDLDGDGAVSTKDFFIASRFDKDQDGVLDAREREECMNALKNGYEARFKFGLDSVLAGTLSALENQTDVLKARVMQRDGKLIEQEDYRAVHEATAEKKAAAKPVEQQPAAPDSEAMKKSRSASGFQTRADLLSTRQQKSKELE